LVHFVIHVCVEGEGGLPELMGSLHLNDEGFLGTAGAGDPQQPQQQPCPEPLIGMFIIITSTYIFLNPLI